LEHREHRGKKERKKEKWIDGRGLPRFLDCAARRAGKRREGENWAAPLGMTVWAEDAEFVEKTKPRAQTGMSVPLRRGDRGSQRKSGEEEGGDGDGMADAGGVGGA
jgi:hypothetical protein